METVSKVTLPYFCSWKVKAIFKIDAETDQSKNSLHPLTADVLCRYVGEEIKGRKKREIRTSVSLAPHVSEALYVSSED